MTRPAAPAHNHHGENPMQYTQPALFPVSDIQVEGYAQPEPRDDEAIVDDEMPEAA